MRISHSMIACLLVFYLFISLDNSVENPQNGFILNISYLLYGFCIATKFWKDLILIKYALCFFQFLSMYEGSQSKKRR